MTHGGRIGRLSIGCAALALCWVTAIGGAPYAGAGDIGDPTLVEADLGDGVSVSQLVQSDRDASTIVVSTAEFPPFRIIDVGASDATTPYSNTATVSANGDVVFEQTGDNQFRRTTRRDGSTVDFTTNLGNDYFGSIVDSSSDGSVIALSASSGALGRVNGFLIDDTGAVLTPGSGGIGSSLNSYIVDLSAHGDLVTWAETSAGAGAQPDRYVRWNRTTGGRDAVERPTEHDAFDGSWTASRDLSHLAFFDDGLLKVRNVESGSTTTLPESAGVVLAYALTNQGDIVYSKNAPTVDEGSAPQVFVWNPTDPASTQISAGVGGATPQSRVEQFGVSPDGTVVTFTSFADNLIVGTSGFERRIYQSRINEPIEPAAIRTAATATAKAVRVG